MKPSHYTHIQSAMYRGDTFVVAFMTVDMGYK